MNDSNAMRKKVKTLYKLARNKLFDKQYYCMYCDMVDNDKEWMWDHIKNIHDEHGKIIREFVCKRTNDKMIEHDIINHIQKD